MAKKLIHDYTFTKDRQDSAGAPITKGGISIRGILPQERWLLVTDVSSGTIIQNFADTEKGISSITFDHNNDRTNIVTEMVTKDLDSTAKLQIFVEDVQGQEVHLADTYIDPVSKIRVSTPENLIDTDFEYGLQSTKWETLELVKNVPTFFSRNGDVELTVTSIDATAGSSNIQVVCGEPHGMSRGNPILVIGTTSYLANGGFVVTAIQDDNTFSFSAKEELQTTQNIKDTYTQIFVGNVYSGTEFDLSNIGGITTNEATPKSTLTVTTKYPTNFYPETSFFLSNSFAKANIEFTGDSTGVSTHLYGAYTATRANKTATNEVSDPGYSAIGGIDLYSLYQPSTIPLNDYYVNDGLDGRQKWIAYDTSYYGTKSWYTHHGDKKYGAGLYFDPSNITVDTGADTISFTHNHNLCDQQHIYYHVGDGNTPIGGMEDGLLYMIHYVDDTTIKIHSKDSRPSILGGVDPNDYLSLTGSPTSGLISKSGMLFTFPCMYWAYGHYFYTTYDYVSSRWNTYKYSDRYDGRNDPRYKWLNENWKFGLTLQTSSLHNPDFYGAHYNIGSHWANPGNSGGIQGPANPKLEYAKRGDNFHPTLVADGARFHYPRIGYPSGQIFYFHQGNQYSAYTSTTNTGGWGGVSMGAWSYTQNGSGSGYKVNNIFGWTPYQDNPTSNSFFFQAHNFQDQDIASVTFDSAMPQVGYPTTWNGGGWDSAGTNKTYEIDYVSTNRIRLIDSTGEEVNLRSAGDSNLDYAFTASVFNPNHNSILMTGNNLQDGDAVTYTNNGATNIPGLTSGTDYYITNRSTNRVSLATGSALWTGVRSSGNVKTATTPSGDFISTGRSDWTDGALARFTVTGTAPGGLANGNWYYIAKSSPAERVRFYKTKAAALAGTGYFDITDEGSGNYELKESMIVDFTGIDSSTHSIAANFVGSADGVYALDSNVGDDGTQFTLLAPNRILRRTLTGKTPQLVDLNQEAFRYPDHGLITGNSVLYTTDSLNYPVGQLVDSSTYYAKRINNNWFRLAATEADALDSASVYIQIDSASGGPTGVGRSTIYSYSIIGETVGPGLINFDSSIKQITGNDTNFTSHFNAGSPFNIYIPETLDSAVINTIHNANDYLIDSSHGLSTGNSILAGGNFVEPPTGLDSDEIVYVRAVDANSLSCHRSPSDATGNTGKIALGAHTGTMGYRTISNIGQTVERTVSYVNSKTKITLDSAPTLEHDSASYSINSALLMRADGFALHRPYDGGVELIPPTNPDARMIRQTRKYFRYQSGKGIQVSFAINFKPPVDIDTFYRDSCVGTITTRYPNRISKGLTIEVDGATNGADGWDSDHLVSKIVNPYTFNVHMGGGDSANDPAYDSSTLPGTLSATGIPSYHVKGWSNCAMRCGLFDDQNGLYFEYNGIEMTVCVRSSIQQLSGTVAVEFNSGKIVGTNTKFTSQVSVEDSIVIKGISYTITRISSDSTLYVLPSYRGATTAGCIVTKTTENKIAQSDWNIDKSDGTGKYGFKLDLSHIQMAYIDYSWYGAGKVRFGFKDQNGNVKYVHEFAHGNYETEAYMRTGNVPARYEIQNSGKPTYVPALAHWGTSVIMDGGFDDDKAYVFTANSLTNTITTGSSITVNGRFETIDHKYHIYNYDGGGYQTAGYAMALASTSADYNSFSSGMTLSDGDSTGNIPAGITLINPENEQLNPRQPYQPDVFTRYGTDWNNYIYGNKNLLLMSGPATAATTADSDYSVIISEGGAISPTKDLPIISIRLAPSVDTNTPGNLGEREIINRMQLILSEVDILSTHGVEIELRLNGLIDNNDWKRVTNPSLSQLIYHAATDEITGGTVVYSFNALGGTGTTNRTPALTSKLLGEVATLGNSILGGNAVFPDGPDVLTVVAKLREDPSTVNVNQSYSISGRISWTESQA